VRYSDPIIAANLSDCISTVSTPEQLVRLSELLLVIMGTPGGEADLTRLSSRGAVMRLLRSSDTWELPNLRGRFTFDYTPTYCIKITDTLQVLC
jgi:hypothetical protein